MAKKEKQQLIAKEPESARVLNHRKKFFTDVMGTHTDEEGINRLTKSESSPHDALKLMRNGCPPNLVVEILA